MLDRLNPTHVQRVLPASLTAGAHYYLLTSRGAELRYADPRADAVRVDVFALDGVLIEEARTANVIGRAGWIAERPPPGNGWTIYDGSSLSWTGDEMEQEHVHPARTVVRRAFDQRLCNHGPCRFNVACI
jgi:hypothetical protein